MKNQLKLCLITQAKNQALTNYQKFITQAVEGGVTLVQLREKSKPLAELQAMALVLKALLKPYKIPLIINDQVQLAKDIDADGVHLGQGDLAPQEARKILGPDKMIGWSVETLQELKLANQMADLNYIAASTVFASKNKMDCKTIWGLNGLRELVRKSRHPVMAIGGIHVGNVQQVMASGAYGVAVISALHDSLDPKLTAKELIMKIEERK